MAPKRVTREAVEALEKDIPFLKGIGEAMERHGVWKIVDEKEECPCHNTAEV